MNHAQSWLTVVRRSPNRTLGAIEVERAPSARFVGSTADGRLIWAGKSGNFNSDGYGVIVVGNRRFLSCEACGLLDGKVTTSATVNGLFLQDLATKPGGCFLMAQSRKLHPAQGVLRGLRLVRIGIRLHHT